MLPRKLGLSQSLSVICELVGNKQCVHSCSNACFYSSCTRDHFCANATVHLLLLIMFGGYWTLGIGHFMGFVSAQNVSHLHNSWNTSKKCFVCFFVRFRLFVCNFRVFMSSSLLATEILYCLYFVGTGCTYIVFVRIQVEPK